MEPIRILQVATIMNRGGLETMLMNYYRKIDRSKIQFDFIVHRQERGHYDDEIESLGGKIYRMPAIKPGNYRKYFRKLDEFFSEHKEYKVVHSHINENSSFVLRAAKKAGIECRIAHNHVAGLGIDYKFPFRMYARYYLKPNANHYFACSDEAGKWLFGETEVKNNNVTILNNAIDMDRFKFNQLTRNSLRKELNIEGKFVVGHVGRFHKSKNHGFLIEVFREVYRKNNNAVLLLIGEGNEFNDIKEKVNSWGLDKVVIFLGGRSDVNALINVMDIFVFPSLFEALPVVLIEAQANGLPIIVSKGIPKEADLTNSINFIDLKLGKDEWCNKILSTKINRVNNREILSSRGYSIDDKVKWITDFYLSQ